MRRIVRRALKWILGVFALLVFGSAGSVYSEDSLETAEALLHGRLERLGGVELLESVKTRRTVGQIKFGDSPETGEIVVEAKAPNFLRITIELSRSGQFIEGFDGTNAWRKNPGGLHFQLEGAEAERLRRAADFYWDLNLKDSYTGWAWGGKTELDGRVAHLLTATDTSQRGVRLWLDEETLFLSVIERTAWFGNQPLADVRLEYADYRLVDGIRIPFSIEQTHPQASSFEFKILSVTHGVTFEPGRFTWKAREGSEESASE